MTLNEREREREIISSATAEMMSDEMMSDEETGDDDNTFIKKSLPWLSEEEVSSLMARIDTNN